MANTIKLKVSTNKKNAPLRTTDAAYSDAYIIVPTTSRQTLATARKVLSQDIIVEPIPSNYGLVTWNGSVLTIS